MKHLGSIFLDIILFSIAIYHLLEFGTSTTRDLVITVSLFATASIFLLKTIFEYIKDKKTTEG